MPRPHRIRSLFLRPKPAYPLPEAARVLAMTVRELRGWVEAGEIEAAAIAGGTTVVPWAELASFAMEWWSQEAVEEALGSAAANVIPELLRLGELEVRIPRFEIIALERVAGRERKSVDALVAQELLDFVSTHAERLSAEVTGFEDAFLWPDRHAAAGAPAARG
jgi:hypothetical protein